MIDAGRKSRLPSSRAVRLALAACLLALVPLETRANPNIQSELTYIEHRPPDDIFGFPGLHLLTRCDVTDNDGVHLLVGPPANATVSCNNNNFPFANPAAMGFAGLGGNTAVFIQLFPIVEADFPNLDGRYTYHVTNNNGNNDSLLSHRLNRMEVVPLPTNLTISNQTTTPLVTFTDPDPTPNLANLDRVYQLVIYDTALNFVAILPPGDAATSPSINIPASVLCPCVPYHIRAQSVDVDTADDATENMAQAFIAFTPTDVPKTGDVNHDCKINGLDIQPFIAALTTSSAAIEDTCPADFNLGGTIDTGDIAPFVSALLAP